MKKNELEKCFKFHVDTYCQLFNVDSAQVLSASRTERNSRARTMIFCALDSAAPGNRSKIQRMLNRKHPYYYHAVRVHEESLTWYEDYRTDFEQYVSVLKGGSFDDDVFRVTKDLLNKVKRNRLVKSIDISGKSAKIVYKSGRIVPFT